MVALVRSRQLDLGDEDPNTARSMIKQLLADEPGATRKVYAALAHKVWTLLVERRLDAELRDWQALLQGVRANIRKRDEGASERMVALADLLRESISLAETSPARDVAQRPHARRILELLGTSTAFVPRRTLFDALGIGTSHLSNVLRQLVMNDLVERKGNGKEAEFRLTALGRQIMSGDEEPKAAVGMIAIHEIRSAAEIDALLFQATRSLQIPPFTPANDLFSGLFLSSGADSDDEAIDWEPSAVRQAAPLWAPLSKTKKYASAYNS